MKKISILFFVIAVLLANTLSAQKKSSKKKEKERVGFTKQINGKYIILTQGELVRALETNNSYFFTVAPSIIIDGCARFWQVPRDSVITRIKRAFVVPYNSKLHHVTNSCYNLSTREIEYSNTSIAEGTPVYVDPIDSIVELKTDCTNPLHDEFLGVKRAMCEARKYDPNEYEIVIDIHDSVAKFGTKKVVYDTVHIIIPCGQCPVSTPVQNYCTQPSQWNYMNQPYPYPQSYGYPFSAGFSFGFANAGLFGQSYAYDLWSRPFQGNQSQGNWSTTNNVYNTTYSNTTWASNTNPGTTNTSPSPVLTNPWRPGPDNSSRPSCGGSNPWRPSSGNGTRPPPRP